MRVGDLAYVGSMGRNYDYKGYPVLIVKTNKKRKTCYGLIEGKIKWYRWLDLRFTP